jgi:hypothetical protein
MSRSLFVEDFQPRSELVVPEHLVPAARFPVVDAHNHLTYPGDVVEPSTLPQMLRELDLINVATLVNLSGGSGPDLERHLVQLDQAYPGRVVTYCNVDFSGTDDPTWTERTSRQLEADVRAGARGLKIYKDLGLEYRDATGRLVFPDDPRISDVWDAAGELGVPVTIHTADPVAFFRPLDRFNERWDELHAVPEWSFYWHPVVFSLLQNQYTPPLPRCQVAHRWDTAMSVRTWRRGSKLDPYRVDRPPGGGLGWVGG